MPQSTTGSLSIIAVCTVAAALGGVLVRATEPQSARYQWNTVTVGGGGFSPNIVFSPVEQGLAYLRTDIGGLYRYDQSQQRWIPLQDGMSEGLHGTVAGPEADCSTPDDHGQEGGSPASGCLNPNWISFRPPTAAAPQKR